MGSTTGHPVGVIPFAYPAGGGQSCPGSGRTLDGVGRPGPVSASAGTDAIYRATGGSSTSCRSLAVVGSATASPRSAARPTLEESLLRPRALQARSTGSPAGRIVRPAPRLVGTAPGEPVDLPAGSGGKVPSGPDALADEVADACDAASRRARTRRSAGLPITPACREVWTRMRLTWRGRGQRWRGASLEDASARRTPVGVLLWSARGCHVYHSPQASMAPDACSKCLACIS